MVARITLPSHVRKYRRDMQLLAEGVWGIRPTWLEGITGDFDLSAQLHMRHGGLIASLLDDDEDDDEDALYALTPSGVAVLPIRGVLSPRVGLFAHLFGVATNVKLLGSAFRAALADSRVRAVALDVDSPGGLTLGIEDLARTIRAMRSQKPTAAIVNPQADSCAYWLASACRTIYGVPGSEAGAIGVMNIHVDRSEMNKQLGLKYTVIAAGQYKAELNPFEPLSDQAKNWIRDRVDASYAQFVGAVAEGRGVTIDRVASDFGRGRALDAEQALAAGIIDRICSVDEALAQISSAASGARSVSVPAMPAFNTGQAAPLSPEDRKVDPEIYGALVALGYIDAQASQEIAQASLRAHFRARGIAEVPADKAAVLAGLRASSAPPAPPAAPDATAQNPPAAGGDGASVLDQLRDLLNGRASTGTRQTPQGLDSARADERHRIRDLQARAEALGVSEEQLDQAIDQGMSVASAVELWTRTPAGDGRQPVSRVPSTGRFGGGGAITGGPAERDKFYAGALHAMELRCPMLREQALQASAEVRGQAQSILRMPLWMMASTSLEMAGVRIVDPYDKEGISKLAMRFSGEDVALQLLALGEGSYNAPGNFPNILSALAGKLMDVAQSYAPVSFRDWCAQLASLPDFKPHTIHQIGEFGELPRRPDGKPAEQSTFSEEVSYIQTDSYVDEFAMTPVMMANDDMGAFDEGARDKTVAHDMTLNRLCIDLLTGNVVLADGNTLFDATNHFNDIISGAGGTPSATQAKAMRIKLRQQKGVSQKRRLGLPLSVALVPTQLETENEQTFLPQVVVPTQDTNTNVFRNKVKPVVDAMLDDSSTQTWYGFADPNIARAIVYCYQQGFEQMKRTTYYDPKTGCMVLQVEGRFAAAVRNWRGVVRNYGS